MYSLFLPSVVVSTNFPPLYVVAAATLNGYVNFPLNTFICSYYEYSTNPFLSDMGATVSATPVSNTMTTVGTVQLAFAATLVRLDPGSYFYRVVVVENCCDGCTNTRYLNGDVMGFVIPPLSNTTIAAVTDPATFVDQVM